MAKENVLTLETPPELRVPTWAAVAKAITPLPKEGGYCPFKTLKTRSVVTNGYFLVRADSFKHQLLSLLTATEGYSSLSKKPVTKFLLTATPGDPCEIIGYIRKVQGHTRHWKSVGAAYDAIVYRHSDKDWSVVDAVSAYWISSLFPEAKLHETLSGAVDAIGIRMRVVQWVNPVRQVMAVLSAPPGYDNHKFVDEFVTQWERDRAN